MCFGLHRKEWGDAERAGQFKFCEYLPILTIQFFQTALKTCEM